MQTKLTKLIQYQLCKLTFIRYYYGLCNVFWGNKPICNKTNKLLILPNVLSVYLQHIPYQYVQPKEEITLALFADARRKPFQFAGSLAEGTTIFRIPVPLISRVDSFKLFIYIDTHPKQSLSFPLIVVVLSHME